MRDSRFSCVVISSPKFPTKTHEDSIAQPPRRPSTIRVAGGCSYLSSFMLLGQQQKIGRKGWELKQHYMYLYIHFLLSRLAGCTILGFFKWYCFFAKAKMTRSKHFTHFFCEVEWLWFKMIQPDMMWIWSNNYFLRFENQPRCSNGPPAMDSCDDTCDIERSMENLGDPAVNSDFPSSKTVLAGDRWFNFNSHVCHHLPWPRTKPTLRSCTLYTIWYILSPKANMWLLKWRDIAFRMRILVIFPRRIWYNWRFRGPLCTISPRSVLVAWGFSKARLDTPSWWRPSSQSSSSRPAFSKNTQKICRLWVPTKFVQNDCSMKI